ncbi:MAG: DUF5343 domain-containing protein [Anaerolineaceae bacterium]|nr:DUF5343 domain-containing protein [Anaerolineaceae bacterium]
MSTFPYVVVQAKLKSFLGEIKRLGVPETANSNWLRTIGYTSSNDLSIPKVLEFIGLVDSSRKPTDKWREFRDENNSGTVLAAAIREGYSALYQIHPDAHERRVDELANFFRTQTEAGDNAVRRTANTFKTLCSLADFSIIQEGEAITEGQEGTEPALGPVPQPQVVSQPLTPSLKVDVQIHIAADADKTHIEEVFKSMAKYLYNRDVELPEAK